MNTPVALTRKQSRAIDRLAINRYGIPSIVLMENAGRGVVDVLLRIDPELAKDQSRTVGILCGKGNNAGDGFVIARHLSIRGARAKIILLCSPEELQGDARLNYEILARCDVPMADLSGVSDLASALDSEATEAAWLIDAMLGTGAKGEPREPVRTAVEWINRQQAQRLAIDVPSGLDCDTGQVANCCVRADHTCTFVASKTGFSADQARHFLGEIHVVSIGIPARLISEVIADEPPIE